MYLQFVTLYFDMCPHFLTRMYYQLIHTSLRYVSAVRDSSPGYVPAVRDSYVSCSSRLVCVTCMYLQSLTRMYFDMYLQFGLVCLTNYFAVRMYQFAPQMWFMTQTSMTQFDSLVTHVCHTHTRAHTHIYTRIHTYTHTHILTHNT